jgi:hypothetical protein
LLSSQMRSCPDSCRMMKHIPSVGFDCDCAGQTCLPSNHYPTFRSAPGWPTWRHCRKSFVPHKPWPEPLVFSAPPPCAHRSPLQARFTPSLQPRTPALVGNYTASGPYPIATSFSHLHRQQGCTVLQRGIHGRFVGTAMSKAVDTHHRKNCSFCISSPPLASAPQRCRPSTPRSRSTCTIIDSR